jgi:integrase
MTSCLHGAVVKARPLERLPVVLARGEVRALLEDLDDEMDLIAGLIRVGGLRFLEALELRVKDLDLERREIHLGDGEGGKSGEGGKDLGAVMTDGLMQGLSGRLARLLSRHLAERVCGLDALAAPGGIAMKDRPARCWWCWQWVFPATRTVMELLGLGGGATTMVDTHAGRASDGDARRVG